MTTQERLQDLARKGEEIARLTKQLALWEAVKTQGIAIATVQSFGFDEKLLTQAQEFEYQRAAVRGQPDPVTGEWELHREGHWYLGERLPDGHYACRVYNYVRHKDGSTTTLNPVLKAV